MKKVTRLFAGLLIAAIAAPLLNASVEAQAPDLLYNETQDYSVTFRGNTEVVVSNRIQVTNNTEKPITEYSFEIPNLAVSDIVGYQVIPGTYCAEYAYDSQVRSSTSVNTGKCVRYQEQMYDSSNGEYKRLSFAESNGKRSITLPAAIAPNKTSTIVISYIGKGYVKKQLGAYKFNFETIKSQNRIKKINVAIDVDTDYVLKDGKSKVNYEQSASATSLLSAGASQADSKSLSMAASSIGSYGGIIEDTSNLAANETFQVKGSYAESAWQLNITKLVLSALVVVLGLVGVIWVVRRIRKVRPAISPLQLPSRASGTLADPVLVVIGFASVAITLIVSAVAIISTKDDYNGDDAFARLLGALIVIILYILMLFAPAILIAAKRRDWRAFVYTLFWVFTWLLISGCVYQWGGISDLVNNDRTTSSPYDTYPIDCREC